MLSKELFEKAVPGVDVRNATANNFGDYIATNAEIVKAQAGKSEQKNSRKIMPQTNNTAYYFSIFSLLVTGGSLEIPNITANNKNAAAKIKLGVFTFSTPIKLSFIFAPSAVFIAERT